jgi:hypothetical protein
MWFKRVAHLITLLAEGCCAAHVTFTLLAESCCAWAGHASLLMNRGPKCVPPSVHLISIFVPSPTMESNIIPLSMPFKLSNSHLVQGKYDYKNAPLQYSHIELHRNRILDKKCITSRKEATKEYVCVHVYPSFCLLKICRQYACDYMRISSICVLKFTHGSRQDAIRSLQPAGERDPSFGHVCWSEGQKDSMRDDWDVAKVGVMFEINKARFLEHADLQEQLLSTGHTTIIGGAS